jgi:hypothetical protein
MNPARTCGATTRPGTRGLVARFPTTNEIAARAHDLFVAEGRRVTRISEYWRKAEQELLDLAARRTLGRTQQPVVEVRRRTETGGAPGWQGATSENIGNI